MPNTSYLCAVDARTLAPWDDERFDPDVDVLASAVRSVPLLWLAMFRERDLARQVVMPEAADVSLGFAEDGRLVELEPEEPQPVTIEAPIADRRTAARQLREALPYLNAMPRLAGRLDEHVELLARHVERARAAFVTIALEEVAGLVDADDYGRELRATLAGMGEDLSRQATDRLLALAHIEATESAPLRLATRLPPPEDDLSVVRLFGAGRTGAGFGAAVPWEAPPRTTRYVAGQPHLVAEFTPRLEVVLRRGEAAKGSPLTEREVLAIRDATICFMVEQDKASPSRAADVDPARCWEDWCARRATSSR